MKASCQKSSEYMNKKTHQLFMPSSEGVSLHFSLHKEEESGWIGEEAMAPFYEVIHSSALSHFGAPLLHFGALLPHFGALYPTLVSANLPHFGALFSTWVHFTPLWCSISPLWYTYSFLWCTFSDLLELLLAAILNH